MRLLILFLLSPLFLCSQTQIGNAIDGILAGNNAGYMVSVPANYSIFTIVSNSYDPTEPRHVRVFENNDAFFLFHHRERTRQLTTSLLMSTGHYINT